MPFISKTAILMLALALTAGAQKRHEKKKSGSSARPAAATGVNAAAEDITGSYSFLEQGEIVQIILDQGGGVTGYITRKGTLDSDRGEILDQFFSKASIIGHDVTFTTKPIHGMWYDFKGRFDRGIAKTKAEDGYYVLRGTLTEYVEDASRKASSHSREVEFKLLGQPDDQG